MCDDELRAFRPGITSLDFGQFGSYIRIHLLVPDRYQNNFFFSPMGEFRLGNRLAAEVDL